MTCSIKIGAYDVFLLRDGTFNAVAEQFVHVDGSVALASALAKVGPAGVTFDVNHFAIRGPNGISLVDAGTGPGWNSSLGLARGALADVGIDPIDVDRVLLTHVHFDHSRGLLEEGRGYFPRAEIFVPEIEFGYFSDPDIRKATPEARQGAFRMLDQIKASYGSRVTIFSAGDLICGFETLALPGHTPGHTGFLLQSEEESVLFWGDAIQLAMFQGEDPGIGLIFDMDPEQAQQTRLQMMETAALKNLVIAGAHVSGFASVVKDHQSYKILPRLA